MKIRFNFFCHQPVPFYDTLCDQFAHDHALVQRHGYHDHAYYLEAEGQQTELEALAEKVAIDFPVSIYLKEANIVEIENFSPISTSLSALSNTSTEQAYCNHCLTQVASHQSVTFGDLVLPCPYCHGETQAEPTTAEKLRTQIDELMQSGRLTIQSHGQNIQLVLPKTGSTSGDILITHPTTIKRHFALSDDQILALSSIEKPALVIIPSSSNAHLTPRIYQGFLAQDRHTLALSELLRLKGIDWVFIESASPLSLLRVTRYDQRWVPVSFKRNATSVFHGMPEPLRDQVSTLEHSAHYQNNTVTVIQNKNSHEPTLATKWHTQAILHASKAHYDLSRQHASLLQLSQTDGGEFLTLGLLNDVHSLFKLNPLPTSGEAIFDELVLGGYQPLIEKYIARWPERMRILMDHTLPEVTNSFSAIWSLTAILLGLYRPEQPGKGQEYLHASALTYQGHNGPGIDYQLKNGELDWAKTLASVMSFLLADDNHINKIAYGCYDSLADALSTWAEEQQDAINVGTVVVTGDELNNTLLFERIRLRLGKNIPMIITPDFGLADLASVVGGLYLPQRQIY